MYNVKVSVQSDFDGVGMTAGQDSGWVWLRETELEVKDTEDLIKQVSKKIFGGIFNKVSSCLDDDQEIDGWWFIFGDDLFEDWLYVETAKIDDYPPEKLNLKDGVLYIVPEIYDERKNGV